VRFWLSAGREAGRVTNSKATGRQLLMITVTDNSPIYDDSKIENKCEERRLRQDMQNDGRADR
jgi:hypothetical protein